MEPLKAAVTWRAKRHDDARRVLAALGGDVRPATFARLKAKAPAAAIGHVYAVTGSQQAGVRRGEAAMRSGDWTAARDGFRAAAVATAQEEATRPYFAARIGLLERHVRYPTGAWVDLKPTVGLTGWGSIGGGGWSVREADGAIFSKSDGSEAPSLIVDEAVGPRFELSGHVRRGGRGGPRAAGLVLTAPAPTRGSPSDARASSCSTAAPGSTRPPPARPPSSTSVCRFDDGKLTVHAAGQTVLDNVELPPAFRVDPRVGINVQPGGRAWFTNLKVRKMSDEPPAAVESGKRRGEAHARTTLGVRRPFPRAAARTRER